MSRILAIDFGRKRCGVAVTDILQIAANGLPTVATRDIDAFIRDYCAREDVGEIVVGLPRQADGSESESMRYIRPFLTRLPGLAGDGVKITMYDERFTSVLAHRAMIAGGVKKSDRREKGLADKTAAVIILTDYLESRASLRPGL